MSSRIRIVTVLGASATLGCDRARAGHPHGTALLSWQRFDGATLNDPQEATYMLNGKQIGRGGPGFLKVLETIRNLPHGTQLWVYPDEAVLAAALTSEGSESRFPHDRETVPFRRDSGLMSKLREVARERGIAIWYLAGAPGEYVIDKGEDLRTPDDSNPLPRTPVRAESPCAWTTTSGPGVSHCTAYRGLASGRSSALCCFDSKRLAGDNGLKAVA